MKTVSAAEFKATCLRLMEQVRRTRAPIRVTKRGKPLADIMPPATREPDSRGSLAGTILKQSDLTRPLPGGAGEGSPRRIRL